jgi:hypothetical protein
MACALPNKHKFFVTQVTSLLFCIKIMSEFTVNKQPLHEGYLQNLSTFKCVSVTTLNSSLTNTTVHILNSSFHKRICTYTYKKRISESRLYISKWLPVHQCKTHVHLKPINRKLSIIFKSKQIQQGIRQHFPQTEQKVGVFSVPVTSLYRLPKADNSAGDRHVTNRMHMKCSNHCFISY